MTASPEPPVFAHLRYLWEHTEMDDRALVSFDAVVAELERAHRIPELIVREEGECQKAITADPTNPFLSGRLLGLQRARDIAASDPRFASHLTGDTHD